MNSENVVGFDCRNAWAQTLEELAKYDERIVAVVNDSVGSSKLNKFRDAYPERLINVGIAEQNMVGVGAGLANGGKVPFVSAASCFLTGRALEQIKADCAYSNANVKLCGMASGVAYGELGATHHSIEDIAWLRPMRDMTVIVPADPWETAQAIRWAADHEGPVFIRVSRTPVPELQRSADAKFQTGKAEWHRTGSDLAIIACGTMVHEALKAADQLEKNNIHVSVLNMSTVSPLDEDAVRRAAACGAVVTVEEHVVRGGLGSAVAECVVTSNPVPMRILGFPGFAETGSAEWLFERHGLNAAGIRGAAEELLKKRAR